MENKCATCKHRFNPEMDGGCTYSESKDRAIRPNETTTCVFSPSRWERKPNPYGKLISPHQEPDPAPMEGAIRSDPIEPNGYAMICRGIEQFLVKDGKCYSVDEEKRYLGTIEEMTPRKPTEQEIDEMVEWGKRKFNL